MLSSLPEDRMLDLEFRSLSHSVALDRKKGKTQIAELTPRVLTRPDGRRQIPGIAAHFLTSSEEENFMTAKFHQRNAYDSDHRKRLMQCLSPNRNQEDPPRYLWPVPPWDAFCDNWTIRCRENSSSERPCGIQVSTSINFFHPSFLPEPTGHPVSMRECSWPGYEEFILLIFTWQQS
ncbi:unnamed protein product [Notodromas monacha]|uniref:Uncharacterized protein n=1 Tax=Notodromas monacha TaxID=399045 RepID=A0A7R9BBI1_9CRUS|nr:unnamed protein product [Notodromas monacha]CAG0912251.1 unnamed protein product [Notodromas monacha]